jgi:hypothetical protein
MRCAEYARVVGLATNGLVDLQATREAVISQGEVYYAQVFDVHSQKDRDPAQMREQAMLQMLAAAPAPAHTQSP